MLLILSQVVAVPSTSLGHYKKEPNLGSPLQFNSSSMIVFYLEINI